MRGSLEGEMEKKNKIYPFIVGLLILLTFYLILTNYIETEKLYVKGEKSFHFSISTEFTNSSCIDVEISGVSYHNDLSEWTHVPRSTKAMIKIYIFLRRKCDFGYGRIMFSVSDRSEKVTLKDKTNLSRLQEYNNKDVFNVYLLNSTQESSQYIEVYIPIKVKFYNQYHFYGDEIIGIKTLSFNLDDRVLGGYYLEDSSFWIEGSLDGSRPTMDGKYKLYNLNESKPIFVMLNPKSKFWFLLQKFVDAIVLGFVVVILSKFPFSVLWKKIKGYLKDDS